MGEGEAAVSPFALQLFLVSYETRVAVYLPHIDGLRAVAIISVIVYHLNKAWFPGGFLGVDIFFVISGFIVSASLNDLHATPLTRFIGYFYAKRLVRIIPALLFCLFVSSLATFLFIPEAYLSTNIWKTCQFAFLGVSNFILAQPVNNYFGPVAEYNVFSHTWSLGVEEQFYVLFPFLFFSWSYLRRRICVTCLFVVAFIASLLFSAWSMQNNPVSAFYMIPSRFWELAAGALLFQAMVHLGYFDTKSNGGQARSKWTLAGAALSFVLLAYGFVFANAASVPYPGAIPTVCGTLGSIFFLFKQSKNCVFSQVLCSKPVLLCGRLSYSLYLWHWPVIVIFRWTIGIETLPHILLALCVTCIMAALSFYCVEKPLRYSTRVRQAPRYAVIAIALLSVAGVFFATTMLEKYKHTFSFHSATKNPTIWYPYYTENTLAEHPERRLKITGRPVGRMQLTTYEMANAALPHTAPNIHVLGDSHAEHYIGMLKQYVLETGASVYMYHETGGSFLAFKWYTVEVDTESFMTAATYVLQLLQKNDIVFLPSLRVPRYVEQWAILEKDEQSLHAIMAKDEGIRMRLEDEKLANTFITLVREKGAQLIFEAPTPIFKAPAFRCAEWFNEMNPICSEGMKYNREAFLELRRPILDIYARLMETHPNVSVWDPLPALCPEGAEDCSALDAAGLPLFFDGDHLSGHANMLLYPYFMKAVRSSLNK